MSEQKAKQPDDAFTRFRDLTRGLVSVPKKELDKAEAAHQRKKARKKKRPA
jgi:hypothetical protein